MGAKELSKGVWYHEKDDCFVVITKAELRDFINTKTYKTSRGWCLNGYVPQYEGLLTKFRIKDEKGLVYIGKY